MKISHKIKSYSPGGAIYTPLAEYQQLQQTQPKSAGSGTPSGETLKGLNKELADIIKQNGIPTDVDRLLKEVNNIMSQAGTTFGSETFTGMSAYTQALSLVNKVKFNKELFDNAQKHLTTERSWGEVAMNERGQLYAKTEEGLTTISADEYYNSPEDYLLLTNNDVLNLRQNDPNLTYNSNILSNMVNSVGMESITNYLKQIVTSLGTQSNEMFVGSKQGEIIKGLEELAMGPTGIYKLTESHQGFDPSDSNSVTQALSYLYQTLPTNMKHVLRSKVAAEGGDPNDMNKNLMLIQQSLFQHTTHKSEVDYDSSASSATGTSPGDNKGKLTHGESIAMGEGAKTEHGKLRGVGGESDLNVWVQNFGAVLDLKGEPVMEMSLHDVLNKADISTFIRADSMFFGDLKINDAQAVIYDGKSGVNRVILPYDVYHHQRTGEYKPDLDMQSRFDEFQKFAERHDGDFNDAVLQQKMQELNLNLTLDVDSSGKKVYRLNPDQCITFLSLSGYSSNDYNGLEDHVDNGSKWIQSVTDSELSDRFIQFANYKEGNKTSGNKRADYNAWRWDMELANIYLAMPDAQISTIALADATTRYQYIQGLKQKTFKTNFN